MIIDAHVHIFPAISGYLGSGETRSEGPNVRWGHGRLDPMLPPAARDGAFPADILIAYMDRAGVDRAVILQGPFYGPHNEYIRRALDAFPDRLLGCGLLDPFVSGSSRLYDRIVGELGFRNLKFECSVEYGLAGIHPEFDYMDPRWQRIWERADSDNLTIVIDTGPPGTPSYDVPRLTEVVAKYEGCRFVIAHLGFPPALDGDQNLLALWEAVLELGQRPNVWFDLAGVWEIIPGDDYPSPVAQKQVQRAVERLGADRFMWGTDVPGMLNTITYQQGLDFILKRCSFLSQNDKKLILGETAVAVYQAVRR